MISNKKYWLIIFFILILTSIPYVVNFVYTPAGYSYTGLANVHSGDAYIYVNLMEQAREGAWILHNPYTIEVSRGYFNPFFVFAGKLFVLAHISSSVGYHLLRILLAVMLMVVLYNLLGLFLEDSRRLLALALLVTAGGVWLPDWITEYAVFLEIYQNPLHLFVIMLIALFFYIYLKKPANYVLYLCLDFSVIVLCYPYAAVIITGIMATYFVVNSIVEKKPDWSVIKLYSVLVLSSIPASLYEGYLFISDNVLKNSINQHFHAGSPLEHLGIYGLLMILAITGLFLDRRRINHYSFVAAWFLAYFWIIYLPLPHSFRMVLGWQIPMAVLAVSVLSVIMEKLKNKAWLLLGAVFFISSFLNVLFVFSDMLWAREHRDAMYYIPQGYIEAFDWLDKHTANSEAVFTGFRTSYFLQAHTCNRVFWGNKWQTYDLQGKLAETANLGDSAVLEGFLAKYRFAYMVYGPWEKNLPMLCELGAVVWEADGVRVIKTPQSAQ